MPENRNKPIQTEHLQQRYGDYKMVPIPPEIIEKLEKRRKEAQKREH